MHRKRMCDQMWDYRGEGRGKGYEYYRRSRRQSNGFGKSQCRLLLGSTRALASQPRGGYVVSSGCHRASPTQQEIADHYASGYEAKRHHRRTGQLDACRTRELMRRFLPPPPAVVRDVGGGPGAYACWLARLLESEPSLVGLSAHLMVVGQK